MSDEPEHLRPFLLETPEPQRERAGRVDLYLPESDQPRPAIVFVHGGPIPAEARPTPRDWPARQAVRSAVQSVLAHLRAG